jgi:hypothetical protein
MMEADGISETSVAFYQTTWRNIPKDNNFHTRRRKNLKSHLVTYILYAYIHRIVWPIITSVTGLVHLKLQIFASKIV